VFDGVALGNGDFVILALEGVEAKEGEAGELEAIRRELSQQIGIDAENSFVAGLHERAEIRILEDRIAADDDSYGR